MMDTLMWTLYALGVYGILVTVGLMLCATADEREM